jgi:hypothetical protein
MASLLGILWETAFGLPALAAFAEQNWLEAYDRPGTPAYFAMVIGWLHAAGLIDDHACPCADPSSHEAALVATAGRD